MSRSGLNFSTTQPLNYFLILTSSFLLFSCAGSRHPRPIASGEGPTAPRYLELYREKQIATLHFPAGIYTLSASDKIGYYYRAPRKISERLGGGAIGREGGIFISKRDPKKLRGYVYRAGAITHIGSLTHVEHRLFDQDIPAASPSDH